MKTILNFRKQVIVNLLFLMLGVGSVCSAQTTTVNAYLSNPCSLLMLDEQSQDSDFLLYPNPNNGILNILINSNELNQDAKIKIFDVLGKLVYEKNFFDNDYSQNLTLNIDNLTSGVYIITVGINEKATSKKLIITK